jgi:hypothetical protein
MSMAKCSERNDYWNAHEDDCTIVRLVFEAVHNWTGNPELQDDMTLLLAREAQTAR